MSERDRRALAALRRERTGLRRALRGVLPYARLYSIPEDVEDFDQRVRRLDRDVRRAERALARRAE